MSKCSLNICITFHQDKYQFLFSFSGNLAIADLFVVCQLPLYPVELLVPNIPSEKWFCFLRIGISLSGFLASALTLILISIDRFTAVIFPLKHYVNSQQNRIYYAGVAVVWIVSLCFGASIVWLNTLPSVIVVRCTSGSTISVELHITMTSLAFVLMFLNSVFYVIIECKINQKGKFNRINALSIARAKMMITVSFAFVACFLPVCILEMIIISDQTKLSTLFCAREFAVLLIYVNSGINWIIYGLANRKFRIAFSAILCRRAMTEEFRQEHSVYRPNYFVNYSGSTP